MPTEGKIERRARIEFDLLAGRLRDAGVEVIIFEDKEELHTPDAVFPNNLGLVPSRRYGRAVSHVRPSRRPERRRDIIEKLQNGGFRVSRVIDLTHHENEGRFLEGTEVWCSIMRPLAYANLSPRTNPMY